VINCIPLVSLVLESLVVALGDGRVARTIFSKFTGQTILENFSKQESSKQEKLQFANVNVVRVEASMLN